ncbi:FliM/FliN family flagellar motor switch protein [Fluviibacterium sp. DFM31]|uniref:FliM/FliN family flagellar motor switch protein n=1 Tax=Meridianimarinicoccus marinus TaxID=3231483 RepID=A0ABV3LAJ8_9RHOB
MTDPAPVLKRMAKPSRLAPGDQPMTLPRAAALAVSRAGQDALKLPLAVAGTDVGEMTVEAVADHASDAVLLVSLRGPGQAWGMAAFDNSLLTAILQAQTARRITDEEPPLRVATQTDAVLCRRFLTICLGSLAERLQGMPDSNWAQGFLPRDQVLSHRRLPHLLADAPHRVLGLDVDIAQGKRRGRLTLILPLQPVTTEPPTLAEDPKPRPDNWTADWHERILDSNATLEAVLMTVRLPLSKVSRLVPGDTLPFSEQTLDRLHLVGTDGRKVARVMLGKSGEFRAVKLAEKVMPLPKAVTARPDSDTSPDAESGGGALVPSTPTPV